MNLYNSVKELEKLTEFDEHWNESKFFVLLKTAPLELKLTPKRKHVLDKGILGCL